MQQSSYKMPGHKMFFRCIDKAYATRKNVKTEQQHQLMLCLWLLDLCADTDMHEHMRRLAHFSR